MSVANDDFRETLSAQLDMLLLRRGDAAVLGGELDALVALGFSRDSLRPTVCRDKSTFTREDWTLLQQFGTKINLNLPRYVATAQLMLITSILPVTPVFHQFL